MTGYILRRRGQLEDGLRYMERAIELDPRNIFILQQVAFTYTNMSRFPEAIAAFDRALAMFPTTPISEPSATTTNSAGRPIFVR